MKEERIESARRACCRGGRKQRPRSDALLVGHSRATAKHPAWHPPCPQPGVQRRPRLGIVSFSKERRTSICDARGPPIPCQRLVLRCQGRGTCHLTPN